MARIISIVEGHAEVEAVPVLIRRISTAISPLDPPEVLKPIRAPRQRVLKEGHLERYLSLAADRVEEDGRILILLDAHEDCPAELGPSILQRAQEARPDRNIQTVLAKHEYEAWFVAVLESIAGTPDVPSPQDPESIQGAKEWLRRTCPPYSPTADQASLTARFDMELARQRSPSFDKMWRAVVALLQ